VAGLQPRVIRRAKAASEVHRPDVSADNERQVPAAAAVQSQNLTGCNQSILLKNSVSMSLRE